MLAKVLLMGCLLVMFTSLTGAVVNNVAYCHTIGESVEDYNLDGVINESDHAVFNYFEGCEYDSGVIVEAQRVTIGKRVNIPQLFGIINNSRGGYFATNYGDHIDEYYVNTSGGLIYDGSYIFMTSVFDRDWETIEEY